MLHIAFKSFTLLPFFENIIQGGSEFDGAEQIYAYSA